MTLRSTDLCAKSVSGTSIEVSAIQMPAHGVRLHPRIQSEADLPCQPTRFSIVTRVKRTSQDSSVVSHLVLHKPPYVGRASRMTPRLIAQVLTGVSATLHLKCSCIAILAVSRKGKPQSSRMVRQCRSTIVKNVLPCSQSIDLRWDLIILGYLHYSINRRRQ